MSNSFCKQNHILVGLGGTGGKILKAFKMRMFEEFPKEERAKLPVALLYVDSTEKDLMGIGRADFDVMGQDASFSKAEFFMTKTTDVPQLLESIDLHPELKGVVDNVAAVRTAIGSLGEAAGQMRRAGRLLFASNADGYITAIKNSYATCNKLSENNSKVFHIFAGLCGGTGSGSIIDAIVQTRKTFPDATINVYAMIPEMDLPEQGMDQGRYYQNGYAALNELNALQVGRFNPFDVSDNSGMSERLELFSDGIKGVANGITLYSNANENGRIVNSFTELPKIVSDYVYARIFLINPDVDGCKGIIRAYNFENMDKNALELDETNNPALATGLQVPPIRTKKLSSFGIKRVIYPEMRVLKHVTYTMGKSVLDQFRYNNWTESMGYIPEERKMDYRAAYLTKDNFDRWGLDLSHLKLEAKVLKTDPDHPLFLNDFDNQIHDMMDLCRSAENPLAEMKRTMLNVYDNTFRGDGVNVYYQGKSRVIPEISAQIRSNVEKELFEKWSAGEVSALELSKVGELLAEYVREDLKKAIDSAITENKDIFTEADDDLVAIEGDWGSVGIFGLIAKKKEGFYSEYCNKLAEYMEAKVNTVALEFARQLQLRLNRDISNMSEDINQFSSMINEAIDETNALIAKQRKINKGIEDMKGAIVEVCEDEQMIRFEDSLKHSKTDMSQIATSLRKAIIPETPFINFADFLMHVSKDTIKTAFDITLSDIVKAKHADLPASETKVLGLNVLAGLKQKLDSHQKIQQFASDIIEQSGVYLYLNDGEMKKMVRNNERPIVGTNIWCTETFVSIPSPEDNQSLLSFANELADAFREQTPNGIKAPSVFIGSNRKNELSVIKIAYCFPMRAMTWLHDYKQRYEKLLHSGNANIDLSNSILLHSEGYGKDIPSMFCYTAAQLQEMDAASQSVAAQPTVSSPAPMSSAVPPAIPGAAVPPAMPMATPEIQLFVAVNGQQYGPFNYQQCQQMIPTGQLTPQSLVWKQGMATWMPASQVPELQALFAPAMPPATPGMPPMPPTPMGMPPVM